VLSLGGAVVLALPTVRQALGMTRVAADGPRFDAGRLVGAMVGLGGSSMLAGLAGVLYVRWVGVADSGVASNLLLPALGAALLGGVSVYGSRGGFAGVILAVGLVVALNKWMPFGDGSFAVHLGLYAVVILVGLQVSWGIGMIARAIDAQREVPPTVSARTVAPTVAAPTVESSAGV
jgi:hypothetical protein